MKILGYLIAGIALIAVLILGTGLVLPRNHVAAVQATYRAPADSIFAAITDVARGAQWRTGVDSVKVLEQNPLKWTEYAEWGNLTMVMQEAAGPSRVVSRIADESQGFGGTWSYDIRDTGAGRAVTITENGFVGNPIYRFMSRFVFGHYTGLETYAKDLGRRFGENIEPQRVKH